ncbi:uncharacterized protein LOC142659995 [Rhinoderma darwinii]|uniref:uncharacterized protein LOC142659995 n=1 Tax=Rhinoderma darwinii TaxID=43563 RepID=UPI003F674EF2
MANAAITTKPSASITTPTTTLGTTTSTSTRTPAPENSAPTEILPVATGSLTSITTTSEIVTTSVDQKETASSNSNNHSTSSQLQDTLSTRPPMESHLSTKASTETLPGNEIQTNSSVKLPTGNTESTTDKMSSTYGRTPGQSTTSDVPISSWKDNTTIQQQSTNTNRTLDPQVVSTGTLTSSTQPDITSEPMKETTPQVVITPPTTKSITPSTVTNGSDAFQSSSSSTYKSSIETYSLPSTVVTTAPHTTLHGLTESPASHSGTTYIAFTSTEKTLSPNTVTFYILQITFTIPSTDVIDEDMVTSLLQSMLNEHLNNTEFAAVQMIVFDTVKYVLSLVLHEQGNLSTSLSLEGYSLFSKICHH